MGNSANRDKRRVDVKKRHEQALDLRLTGLSYRAIAKRLGMSVGGVHKAVDEEIEALPREKAEAVRAMEIERCDAILASLWPGVQQGKARAAEVALKVSERRSRLLGLDAPDKHDHTVEHKGEYDEVLRKLARIAEARGAGGSAEEPERAGTQDPEVGVEVLGKA